MRIPVVDENDNIVDVINSKAELNLRPELIYRVASLVIYNSKGDVLLARRAWDKTHDPGKWGPAAAGTVEEGETYESNIIKEAEEELGLKDIKPVPGDKKRKKTQWNYFIQQFSLILDNPASDFQIQKDEVAEVKWFSQDELKKELQEHPEEFSSGVKDYVK
jgi:isopentenyl-diphosphate Delta-isomerase